MGLTSSLRYDLLSYGLNDINVETYETGPASPVIEPQHRAVQPRSLSNNILKTYRRRRAAHSYNGSPVAFPDPFRAENIFALDSINATIPEKATNPVEIEDSSTLGATSPRKVLTPKSVRKSIKEDRGIPDSARKGENKHLSPEHIVHILFHSFGNDCPFRFQHQGTSVPPYDAFAIGLGSQLLECGTC